MTYVQERPPDRWSSRCRDGCWPALNRYDSIIVDSVAGTVAIMNNPGGRVALIVVGAVALIVGAIFAGQGAGFLPGSFMTGDRIWLTIGLIVGFVGIILLVLGLRRPSRRSES